MSTFKELYNKEIIPALKKEYNYKSVMQVPKLEKIVINVGVGDAKTDEKYLDAVEKEIAAITGQKGIVTRARKSIAGFKLREGQPIGVKVTLRGENMYNFLEKLVKITLPRVRDFHGSSKNAFDGHGNYTLGLKDQLVFPEIVFDNVLKIRGMDIVFVTTANTNGEALSLLKGFGMPFRN